MEINRDHYKRFVVIPYVFVESKSYDLTIGWLFWCWTFYFTPAEIVFAENEPMAKPYTADEIFDVLNIDELNDVLSRLDQKGMENDNGN